VIPHLCYGNTVVHPLPRRSKVTPRQIAYPIDVEAGKTYYPL
jgi:hypothetical protein